MRCPNCGAVVGSDELFCGECGTRIVPPSPPAVLAPPAPRRGRGSSLWIPLAVVGCLAVVVVVCLALTALGGVGALLAPDVISIAQQATPTNTPRPPSPTPKPTATPRPSPTATVTPPAGELVYQDDFSRITGDWSVSEHDDYSRAYRGGEYHFTMKSTNSVYWSILKKDFKDFHVQTDARLVDGPTSGAYVLVFRYQDKDNYYLFNVFPSGHYWLNKQEGGKWTTLIKKTESVYIHQDKEINRLRVECAGYWIRLYVNDQYLIAALDNSFREGRVGVGVSTWADGEFHAAFDNFKVWEE